MIQHSINATYVSPCEIVWHILLSQCKINRTQWKGSLSTLIKVVFEQGREEKAIARAEGDTKLTGCFNLNGRG